MAPPAALSRLGRRLGHRLGRRLVRGATLVEPLVASVVAGTLAAVALPKLADVAPEARTAALEASAGAATSAMQLNLAGCALTDQHPREGLCTVVRDCAQVGALLVGGLPSPYAVTPQPLDDGAPGRETRCTIALADGSASAAFIGVAAGR